MTIDIFTEAINVIQRINEGVNEIDFAPKLEDYPSHASTMILPMILTQISANSSIPLNCPAKPATLNMTITAYIEAEKQGTLNLEKVYRIAGSWRKKYLDPKTYLNNDANQKELVIANGLQIYINPTGAETFSGYQVVQYPFGSGNRYHCFVCTLSLRVQDASC